VLNKIIVIKDLVISAGAKDFTSSYVMSFSFPNDEANKVGGSPSTS